MFVRVHLRSIGVLVAVVAMFGVTTATPAVAERAGVPAARAKPAKLSGSITVSAAASLTEAFTQMGADFRKHHKGTTVTFNFASSSTLAAQIQGGAPADVFASADRTNMQKVVSSGQVTADPVDFTANLLTIVVKKGNPSGVEKLGDLPGQSVVSLCAPAVPCGRYATRMLTQGGVAIPADRVTLGQDVKATLAAVSEGDADAGIVFVTDAKAARSSVTQVKIPASLNVLAIYPIAPVASSQNTKLAQGWIDYVVSSAGRKTLKRFGFVPVPAT